jgi:RNA polymerase sigma-70 factor (ECF subfamily)
MQEPDSLRERGRWLARNVLPHEALIRAKLCGMCLCGLDIEDVLQEMYAKFMNHKALDSIRYPRQYALLVARGIIIDHLRHSRVVPISSSGNLELLDVPELDANVEERLEFRQEVAAVTAALNEFPKLCREVLILRRIEGLSQKDVAQRLGISEKTVEKYMAIGVRLLIDAFGRGGRSRVNTTTTRQMGLSTNVNGK